MNITFMIGNGFDLNLGLKTGYGDFTKIYVEPKAGDCPVIAKFKHQLSIDFIEGNWSDLELYLGEYSKYVKDLEEFSRCLEGYQ